MDPRCQYASTYCPNTRSQKISGELHRFCLFHRRSANAAQRRWKQKKLATANATTNRSTSSGASNSTSEDDNAVAKPTKLATRRRQRHETVKIEPVPTKQRRLSREIAAPRFFDMTVQEAVTMQLPPMVVSTTELGLELDALPPLFANEDLDVVDKTFETTGPLGSVSLQEPAWDASFALDCGDDAVPPQTWRLAV